MATDSDAIDVMAAKENKKLVKTTNDSMKMETRRLFAMKSRSNLYLE